MTRGPRPPRSGLGDLKRWGWGHNAIKFSLQRSCLTMPSFSRHVSVDWSGPLREGGKGIAHAGTGAFNLPVTFLHRIGEPEGETSPEELIAAAHAVCYTMVINATVGRMGGKIEKTHVTCTITA